MLCRTDRRIATLVVAEPMWKHVCSSQRVSTIEELIKDQPVRERDCPIYAHLTDLGDVTLCPKLEAA